MATKTIEQRVLVGRIFYNRQNKTYVFTVFDADKCDLADQTGVCRDWWFDKDQVTKLKKLYKVSSAQGLIGAAMIGEYHSAYKNVLHFKRFVKES